MKASNLFKNLEENNIKLAGFSKISKLLKRLGTKWSNERRLELTQKELNKMKNSLKEMYNTEVDKDFKRVHKQAYKIEKKMKKYVRDFFFDENIPSDFDNSSQDWNDERSTNKNEKEQSRGLNVLIKAQKKIDQLAHVCAFYSSLI